MTSCPALSLSRPHLAQAPVLPTGPGLQGALGACTELVKRPSAPEPRGLPSVRGPILTLGFPAQRKDTEKHSSGCGSLEMLEDV